MGDWSRLLYGKVVFLTGGAGQIAQSIAATCYVHGARIVLGDLDIAATNKVKEEIEGKENKEDRVLVVQLDVRDEASIEQAVKVTVEKWKTIDVLLNT
jgi:NADP-dependent 3-hydroxy acid dehydrogenase YdfG